MKKLLPLTALALVLSGGVALADRGHDNHRGGDRDRSSYRTSSSYRDHGNRNWNRGNTVVVRHNDRHGWNGNSRVVVRNDHYRHGYRQSYRRPIYVSRPVIHQRYYNYYRRPAIIVENYAPQAGYYWVAGAWSWSGAEWIWQPGHYEPDPSYVDQSGYYDNSY